MMIQLQKGLIYMTKLSFEQMSVIFAQQAHRLGIDDKSVVRPELDIECNPEYYHAGIQPLPLTLSAKEPVAYA